MYTVGLIWYSPLFFCFVLWMYNSDDERYDLVLSVSFCFLLLMCKIIQKCLVLMYTTKTIYMGSFLVVHSEMNWKLSLRCVDISRVWQNVFFRVWIMIQSDQVVCCLFCSSCVGVSVVSAVILLSPCHSGRSQTWDGQSLPVSCAKLSVSWTPHFLWSLSKPSTLVSENGCFCVLDSVSMATEVCVVHKLLL